MNMATLIVAGIVVGWIANRMLNEGASDGRLAYLGVGVLGAFAGVQLLLPMFGTVPVDASVFSMATLMFAATGAAIVLFVGAKVRERWFP